MNIGTRSLLFGVHHWLIHPITVYIAWCKLYGMPSWREAICIFVHDWGYWGLDNMDGRTGREHPFTGAIIADLVLGHDCYDLCLLHSRHLATSIQKVPSKLCWADKASMVITPGWLYLFLASLSGEIHEYRLHAAKSGSVGIFESNQEWFRCVSDYLKDMVERETRKAASPGRGTVENGSC